jgi:hypothetical protein
MTKKIWHIQEGLYFEILSDNVFALIYEPDESCISLCVDEIDDIMSALKRVMAHYKAIELAEKEREMLATWGKKKRQCLENTVIFRKH